MERGTIPVSELPGGLDLYLTLESGQTYLWGRDDGRMYDGERPDGAWYYTVVDDASSDPDPDVVRVRVQDGSLEWETTAGADAEETVRRLLRLDDDLEAVVAATPDDPLLAEAYDTHRGLRLVEDPAFGCLISFICSAQMRVSRIHSMVSTVAREYGTPVEFDGRTYHAFPTPAQLAAATEDELRELGLGYRAPYVVRTAEMVADGDAHPAEARDLAYEEARDYLCQFVGVGDKVADCVLLFSLGFDQAVPLDTWIRSAIEDYYPDCDCGSYAATSRAIREQFGGEYAGYAQTYVFHHLRTGE
ncbi:DNA-3-methyladenine glycosylase family protein [Halobiforma nitratireducens]|uniref:DNA-(apurinic or apyrimidinic site) lyase n=1 Tax=Halobiforma nitratireducens JCM 10879 TaxID=1227454 RepID=M0LG10_9EURY|nr:DNA glycosylase [Halobiforma nitratireducens]EMA31389.1 8-oxoguanine DNA glycosylase domain-containing protein [Halobiforma nitratireducens JCM 10879]